MKKFFKGWGKGNEGEGEGESSTENSAENLEESQKVIDAYNNLLNTFFKVGDYQTALSLIKKENLTLTSKQREAYATCLGNQLPSESEIEKFIKTYPEDENLLIKALIDGGNFSKVEKLIESREPSQEDENLLIKALIDGGNFSKAEELIESREPSQEVINYLIENYDYTCTDKTSRIIEVIKSPKISQGSRDLLTKIFIGKDKLSKAEELIELGEPSQEVIDFFMDTMIKSSDARDSDLISEKIFNSSPEKVLKYAIEIGKYILAEQAAKKIGTPLTSDQIKALNESMKQKWEEETREEKERQEYENRSRG